MTKRIYIFGALSALILLTAILVITLVGQDSTPQPTSTPSATSVHSSGTSPWASDDAAPGKPAAQTQAGSAGAPATSSLPAAPVTWTGPENRPAFLGGEVATGTATVRGKVYKLQPNQIGDLGRIDIAAKTKVQVSLNYPQADANLPVVVEAEDGGTVVDLPNDGNDGRPTVAGAGQIDSNGQLNFAFQSGTQDGIYRVTLRQGADLKQIDFWVGPELPISSTPRVTE